MTRSGWLDPNWQRIARWCCLVTVVMFFWLLAPTIRCSFAAFRDEPIGEMQPSADPGAADKARVQQSKGFFERVGGGAKQCYLANRLFDQEPWKEKVFVGFGIATVLAWALRRLELRRRRTYG